MSTLILGKVWLLELEPTVKLVLVSLADQANDEGMCWPSVGSISRRTGLSERAVRLAFTRLENRGLIWRTLQNGRSNMFTVLPDPPVNSTPARGAPLHDVQPPPARGAPTPARGAPTPARGAPTPARGAPINVMESSLNQEKSAGRSRRGPPTVGAERQRSNVATELETAFAEQRHFHLQPQAPDESDQQFIDRIRAEATEKVVQNLRNMESQREQV